MRNRTIIKKTCKLLSIEQDELLGKNRNAVYSEARLLITNCLLQKGLDVEDVAQILNRNRTTIYYYIQEIDNRNKYDTEFRNKMRLFKKHITP